MRKFTDTMHLTGFCLLLACLVGCAGADSTMLQQQSQLTIVGSQEFKLIPNQQVTLKVRYTRFGQEIADTKITFSLLDQAKDAWIHKSSVVTNQNGIAEVILEAGQVTESFRVDAYTNDAGPAIWHIEVNPARNAQNSTFYGTFSVLSQFNVDNTLTGATVGGLLNQLNEMSDDPYDPGQYIVDLVIDNLDEDLQVVTAIFRPVLYPAINSLLLSLAPNLVTQFKTLAQEVAELTRRFELSSSLINTASQGIDTAATITHRVEKMNWTLQGKRVEISFDELGIERPEAKNVRITMGHSGLLSISSHQLDLQLGPFFLEALNSLVIPELAQNAHNLGDLLRSWIDCDNVGREFNNTVQFMGAPFWTATCHSTLTLLGKHLEAKLLQLDQSSAVLTIGGQCQLEDKDRDGYYDQMFNGNWYGNFSLDQNTAVLKAQGNTFSGQRIR